MFKINNIQFEEEGDLKIYCELFGENEFEEPAFSFPGIIYINKERLPEGIALDALESFIYEYVVRTFVDYFNSELLASRAEEDFDGMRIVDEYDFKGFTEDEIMEFLVERGREYIEEENESE